MLAYAQEAKLLQVEHFAPLDRTPEDIRTSSEYYLGALHGNVIVGSLSLGSDDEPDRINIASLVVHPEYQRQGIGRSLLTEALRRGEGMTFSVSTGAKNTPALALYGEFRGVSPRNDWPRGTGVGQASDKCALTRRSRRGPTAWHQARLQVWHIILPAGLAPRRRSRLTSNVRPLREAP